MGFFIQRFRSPVNTDPCSDGIHIRDLVSHNHNLILAHHKFTESVGFYPGFYPGALAHLLGFAAKVCHLIPIFDHYLIASTAKSQVDGNAGILIILGIGRRINADTDADGNCHIISNVDSFHILQNIKPVFLQFFQRPLAHYQNKLIFFQLFDQTVHFSEIFIQLSLDQSYQK